LSRETLIDQAEQASAALLKTQAALAVVVEHLRHPSPNWHAVGTLLEVVGEHCTNATGSLGGMLVELAEVAHCLTRSAPQNHATGRSHLRVVR
jgi:hypothetical protein